MSSYICAHQMVKRSEGLGKRMANLEDAVKAFKGNSIWVCENRELGLISHGEHMSMVDDYYRLYLDTLPGMCGVLVVHNFWNVSSTNLSNCFPIMDHLATYGNYTKILVSHYNLAFWKMFEENGYKQWDEFVNRRTSNRVRLYMKDVSK